MKLTTLACATLTMSIAGIGCAHAESSVTLYGFLDAGYGYQHYTYDRNGADARSTSSGLRDRMATPNRWGLRGSEDMGSGLRALFVLEGAANMDGVGNGFERQTYVGLSHDSWGTLTMGQQYAAGATQANTNLTVNGMGLGNMNRAFGPVNVAGGMRMGNSFKYVTPNLGGFQLITAYGTKSGASTTVAREDDISLKDRGSWLSLGAKYANGPLAVAGSYDRQGVTGDDPIVNWQINGTYDFKVAKLALAFGQDHRGKLGWVGSGPMYIPASALPKVGPGYSGGALAKDFKSSNYHVGVNFPIGGGTLYGGWLHSSSNMDDSDKWGDDGGNINTYHLNYKYKLSKRTTVYTYASYGQNLGYVRDLNGTEAGVGMMHTF